MDTEVVERKQKHVAEEYLSSLSDLQCNSKPLINVLTMLAEENIEHAPIIVKVVEQHIAKVRTDLKLPVLYLIDSIVKNVKGTYITLFGQCIVNIFCDVFEKVNEKVRERMYALRQTWNEVFTPNKLYTLDVRVKQIDKNWPITAVKQQPTAIHVNPNFLKPLPSNDIEDVLKAKTRELLELKKRKLELELEATKKHLEEQEQVTTSCITDSNALVEQTLMPHTSTQIPLVAKPVRDIAPIENMHASLYGQNYVRPTMRMAMPTQHNIMPMGTQMHPGAVVMQTHMNKVKVHPVNPALVNSIRHRDPRLMRQQQPQQQHQPQQHQVISNMRKIPTVEPQQTHQKRASPAALATSAANEDATKHGKRESSKARKSNRSHDAADSTKSTSGRFPPPHRSSNKNITSRDKDRDRKRSSGESKSHYTSSNERRQQKNRDKQTKSEKESSDVNSSPSRRNAKSPSSSPIKLKDSNRRGLSGSSNKSSNTVKNGQIRRSNSPTENIVSSTKDVDLRSLTLTADSLSSATSSTISTAIPEPNKKSTIVAAAVKGLEQNIKRELVEHVAVTVAASAIKSTPKIEDVDLRQLLPAVLIPATANTQPILPETSHVSLPSSVSVPVSKANLDKAQTTLNLVASSSSTKSPTTPNQSTKVSFKIQKLFNKLAKSTEAPATVTTSLPSTSSASSSSSTKNILEENNTKNVSKPESMDIDDADVRDSEETGTRGKINSSGGMGKKRVSGAGANDEPIAKKSKATKMDALFGSEDVDLRTLAPPILAAPISSTSEVLVAPPPPNISSSEDDQKEEMAKNRDSVKATKSSSATPDNQSTVVTSQKIPSNFEDVRAKLAKATKIDRLSKSERAIEKARTKLSEINQIDDETTQEANDEKIRIILSQAQEMLESNSISKEKYKQLVQTVMSMNEENKLKEAKRRESLQLQQSSIAKSPKDINDPEAEENDEVIDVELMAARDAVLRKRIPKLRKNAIAPANAVIDITHNKSPIAESEDVREGASNLNRLKPKEKRQRHSKWGENQGNSQAGQRPWIAGSGPKRNNINAKMPVSTPPPPQPPIQPIIIGPNQLRPLQGNWTNTPPIPFAPNAPMPLVRSSVPPPPQPPMSLPPVLPTLVPSGLPKPCNSIDNPQADLVRTINIDGQSKDIRIYDDVAIVFMDHDEPREIGFQPGQRAIKFDNQEPIVLRFNDKFKPIMIAGEMYNVRFGFPSRELYIDEHWYEIYFGGPPVSIPIKNRIHILKAEGPPPQVTIGPLRRDLVVGRIHMIVEAINLFPLFLDARIQTFRYDGVEHTVQFADNLLTVLLDGQPQQVEYGGLPKSFMLNGKRYFIRFTTLPKGVVAGKVEINNMIYVKTEPPVKSEQPAISPAVVDDEAKECQQTNETEVQIKTNDIIDENKTDLSTTNSATTTALGKINIDELFKKLVSTGILNNNVTSATLPTKAIVTDSEASLKDSNMETEESKVEENSEVQAEVPEVEKLPPIVPIDLSKSDSLKTRQEAIVSTLYSGMQCSSCGVRFPPEQTIKYSQHLDWHFRQNRRERDSTRKAHSRKWYYDLNDWLQYEEIEDLDEREKNFFETQQGELETLDDISNQRSTNSPQPTCPAGPDDVDRTCDMCHEKFEQFYNEELEEWHLRLAVRVEDKIYHPLCYEDYKASLIQTVETEADTSAKSNEVVIEDDDNAVDVVIKIEDENGNEDPSKTAVTIPEDDDDDDVIVLPNEEPSVTEIDDDEEEYVPATVTREEMQTDRDNESTMESDVEIQEPNIPFTDLDTYEEKVLPVDENSQASFMNVKIKEEPNVDDEDDAFEEVGTVMYGPHDEISIQSSEETQTQTIISSVDSPATISGERSPATNMFGSIQLDSTTTAKITQNDNLDECTAADISIDGNLKTADGNLNLSTNCPPPAILLGSLVNKIKINITKNIATAANTASSSNASSTDITTTTNLSSNSNGSNEVINVNTNTHVISTIPVLCTMTPKVPNVPNVSNISVIGSYHGGYQKQQQQPQQQQPITSTITTATRQRSPTPPTAPVEETITYELKPALKKATLKKMKKVECGIETSGLCSIM